LDTYVNREKAPEKAIWVLNTEFGSSSFCMELVDNHAAFKLLSVETLDHGDTGSSIKGQCQ
jgi:hypothetical protein